MSFCTLTLREERSSTQTSLHKKASLFLLIPLIHSAEVACISIGISNSRICTHSTSWCCIQKWICVQTVCFWSTYSPTLWPPPFLCTPTRYSTDAALTSENLPLGPFTHTNLFSYILQDEHWLKSNRICVIAIFVYWLSGNSNLKNWPELIFTSIFGISLII